MRNELKTDRQTAEETKTGPLQKGLTEQPKKCLDAEAHIQTNRTEKNEQLRLNIRLTFLTTIGVTTIENYN